MADVQVEKAYLKQEGVFRNSKKFKASITFKGFRYYKDVGLGFKTPK